MRGDRLRELREGKKMYQEDLAKKINVSKSTIGMYERNEREPNDETLLRLSSFFDCSTDYLLGRSDDPRLSEKEDKEADERARELLEILESMEDEEERKKLEEQVLAYAKFLKEADKSKK